MTRWIRVQDSQDFVRSTSRFSSSPVQPSTAQLCLGITVVGAVAPWGCDQPWGLSPLGVVTNGPQDELGTTPRGAPRGDTRARPEVSFRGNRRCGISSEQGIFGSISQKPIDSDPIGSDVAAGLGQQPRFQHVSSRHGKGSQSPSEETAS